MAKGILVLPPESRIWERPDRIKFLPTPPLPIVKIRRACTAWIKKWITWSLVPFFGREEWLPFVIPALALLLLFPWYGHLVMPQELLTWWQEKEALLWALPLYLLVTAFVAAVLTFRDARRKGKWEASTYTYNQKQHVFTTTWTPDDNGTSKTFKFKDAEPGSLVHYKIEFEGPKERIWGVVLGKFRVVPENEFVAHARYEPDGKAVLGNDRELELRCFSKPNTIPAIVYIYILSWELYTDDWMSVTNDEAGVRCTLQSPNATKPMPKGN